MRYRRYLACVFEEIRLEEIGELKSILLLLFGSNNIFCCNTFSNSIASNWTHVCYLQRLMIRLVRLFPACDAQIPEMVVHDDRASIQTDARPVSEDHFQSDVQSRHHLLRGSKDFKRQIADVVVVVLR